MGAILDETTTGLLLQKHSNSFIYLHARLRSPRRSYLWEEHRPGEWLRSMPGGRVLLLSSPSGTHPVSVTSAIVLSQGEYVNRLSLLFRKQHPSQRRWQRGYNSGSLKPQWPLWVERMAITYKKARSTQIRAPQSPLKTPKDTQGEEKIKLSFSFHSLRKTSPVFISVNGGITRNLGYCLFLICLIPKLGPSQNCLGKASTQN